ncbi:hypothetical protein AMTR_s00343p00013980 [Amborella trichopoda]|uniref:CRIB domain-containing protein n=2 Tax=Amborella trichopoda TaxID=13333 RepID=W1NXE3_AMBTC|nr:hypothetical protein AMTR_s00343p00013980 [Amborella trichopoda]
MERLVILPFSIGCASPSSTAVKDTTLTKSPTNKPQTPPLPSSEMKNPFSRPPISKPLISSGLHRLVKRFKSLTQIFMYKEEELVEMEIGFPTDVKHVAHIGWDGSGTGIKRWEGPEVLAFPSSVSLREFEAAMAAQTKGEREATYG